MTTLDPGGPHVDGRDMLIAELEDRLTAAQGEIRRLLALVEEHRDRAEAAHNLHANAERLLAEAKRRECTALCRDVEEDRDRLLPVVEAVGKWVEVRQNPRMVATDHDDRALMIAYAAMPAVDALGTDAADAADGAGTGEIPLMLCPRGDGHALMITELTFTCPKCAAQIVEPTASPAGSSTADEGVAR